jgi:predicted Fe-Mo cluster-binding NifX family protein
LRIAVATDDQATIAKHFGRCQGFEIFDVDGNNVSRVEFRTNGSGHHHHHGSHEHDSEHDHHSHEHFLRALHDCQVVISRGMGRRALADLKAGGITPAVVLEDVSIARAAELYVQGLLTMQGDSNCCSH